MSKSPDNNNNNNNNNNKKNKKNNNNNNQDEIKRTDPILVERRPGESDASFTSRRNRIYGRRFHERKRKLLAALMDQKTLLEASIRVTRCDNERLKNLLKKAQLVVREHNAEPTSDLSR